jgi:UDP-N-acetylmuramyl pentapeptide synthase
LHLALSLHFDKVVVVGNEFGKVYDAQPQPSSCLHFETTLLAKEWFTAQDVTGRALLIKGSRGMQMETLLAD